MDKKYSWLGIVALVIVAGVFLYPLLWLIDSAFRPALEIFQVPPVILQSPPWESMSSYSLDSFAKALGTWNIGKSFLVSVGVTVSGILLTLLLCSLTAYAFAFLDFPGKNLMFLLVLTSMMLPMTTMIVPYYKVLNGLRLTNTLAGLIIPYGISAFGVFLLRQYYIRIPRAYVESARMDGASHLRVWWSIIVPLSKPALAALAIIQFRQIWNDFLIPMILLRNNDLYTLPISIQVMDSVNVAKPYDVIIASGLITALVPMTLFVIFQRYFIQGLVGGVKE